MLCHTSNCVSWRSRAVGVRNNSAQVCHAVATETTKPEVAEKRQVVSYDGVDFTVDENPELKSSWGQRVTVASSSVAMGLLMASGFSHGIDGLQAGLCIFAGYIFAGLTFSDGLVCMLCRGREPTCLQASNMC